MKLIHRVKYRNLKNIPTAKLKAILDDPYTRGKDGKDYEPVRDELLEIYWQREGKRLIAEELAQIAVLERFDHASLPNPCEEAQNANLPPIPTPEAPLVRVLEYIGEEVTSFREFWKLDRGEFLELPPVILEF